MTTPRVLQDLDLLVMLADLEDASTPDYANRPLEDWEQDTDWEAITAALAGAYAAIEGHLTGFHRVYVDELAALLRGATTVAEAVARFFTWSMQLPAVVRAAADRAVRSIAETLARLQDQAASIAVNDAVSAKIIRSRRPYLPAAATVDQWLAAASLPVGLIAARTQTVVTNEIGTPFTGQIRGVRPPDPQRIVDLAKSMSLAGAVDKGRQAAHQAAGAGRLEAAEKMADDGAIGYFYASELLDAATCDPCAGIDGTEYDTMEAALADYPGFGGYKNCSGGDRCRGTIVIVGADESPTTADRPGDSPGDSPGDIPPSPTGPVPTPDLQPRRGMLGPNGTDEFGDIDGYTPPAKRSDIDDFSVRDTDLLLNGTSDGHGFHGHGRGKGKGTNGADKSEFPQGWEEDETRRWIRAIADNPMSARPALRGFDLYGIYDGVAGVLHVRSWDTGKYEIATAYPLPVVEWPT